MLTSEWPTSQHPEHVPFVVRQVKFLQRKGIAVDVFHVDGRKNPARYFRARRRVSALIASKSYDVVHAQWAQAAACVLPTSHLPLVVTFRGSDVHGIVSKTGRYTVSGWILRQIAKFAACQAEEAILVSARLARDLPRRHYHIIPSGLDFETFQVMPQIEAKHYLGLRPDRRYILFAAAPNKPVKRYSLARAAIQYLDQRYCAELLVADGIPPAAMSYYMNACDALLLTSLHEGSPNVVKEALACNLAVVSTNVGDVAQRTAEVQGCAICYDEGPQSIAAALAQVLDRRERIQGRLAVRDLDEGIAADRVISVYQLAIESSRHSNPFARLGDTPVG